VVSSTKSSAGVAQVSDLQTVARRRKVGTPYEFALPDVLYRGEMAGE
jgi:hypothetical protein